MLKKLKATLSDKFKQSGLRWLWLSLLAIGLDQVTKLLVIAEMRLYESIPVIPFFNITRVHNEGAAFSFLADAGGWQRWFFTIIAIAISSLIFFWLTKTRREQILLPMAFCLILGGAIGNLIDRVAYGYVVDFLDVYYKGYHWPAFNIADSAIFLGAVLLLIDAFKNTEEKSENND